MNAQPFQCTIKGTVSDTSIEELKLFKFLEVANDSVFVVPVKNGKFNYTFQFDKDEAYRFEYFNHKSEGWIFPFFPIDGEINFTLFPLEINGSYLINKIEGGQINQEYMGFREIVGTQYNIQIDQLYNRWDSLEEAGIFTMILLWY